MWRIWRPFASLDSLNETMNYYQMSMLDNGVVDVQHESESLQSDDEPVDGYLIFRQTQMSFELLWAPLSLCWLVRFSMCSFQIKGALECSQELFTITIAITDFAIICCN